MYKYTRDEGESLAENLEWIDILPLAQSKVLEEITLKNGKPATVREIDFGADRLAIVTSPEAHELVEIRPDKHGKRWSKFEAIKHLRFGGDHNKTMQFLSSRFEILDTSLPSLGRELVGERVRDSLGIPPSERGSFDSEFADLVARQQYEMEARELAKENMRTAALDREPESPEPTWLADLLEQEEEPNDFLIDGLLPIGSTGIVFAQAKVGKTTFAGNLIRALADHEPFLDWFTTNEHVGSLGYMNYELNPGQCRRWFGDLGIKNADKVAVWNLRGRANPIRSRESMVGFANRSVAPFGIETLVLDPFSGAFAGDTNNNDEVKRFFLLLEDFKVAAGITNLVIVVHAGNDSSRPRGATTLRDHPDALWSLSKDSSGRRYLKAEGRDVAVDEGELLYEPTTRRLTFVPSSGRRSASDGLKAKILEFIAAHPGCKARDVDAAIRASKEKKATLRNELALEGKIEVRDGGRNAKLFYPVLSLPVVLESFREDGTLGASSHSPLFIGGTTAPAENIHMVFDEAPVFEVTTQAAPEQDWPSLIKVAGL